MPVYVPPMAFVGLKSEGTEKFINEISLQLRIGKSFSCNARDYSSSSFVWHERKWKEGISSDLHSLWKSLNFNSIEMQLTIVWENWKFFLISFAFLCKINILKFIRIDVMLNVVFRTGINAGKRIRDRQTFMAAFPYLDFTVSMFVENTTGDFQ